MEWKGRIIVMVGVQTCKAKLSSDKHPSLPVYLINFGRMVLVCLFT